MNFKKAGIKVIPLSDKKRHKRLHSLGTLTMKDITRNECIGTCSPFLFDNLKIYTKLTKYRDVKIAVCVTSL